MRSLEDIRALCDAATPGPWEVGYGGSDVYSVSCDVNVAEGDVDEDIDPEQVVPNAEFIAHSRQDIPDLLAALAEKDAEIERLKAAAERFSRKIAGLPE